MIDIMLDLETLGTSPGCSVLSIGAARFSIDDETPEDVRMAGVFEIGPICRRSCAAIGLKENPLTVEWWGTQSAEARERAFGGVNEKLEHVVSALQCFRYWLAALDDFRIWGNGADFDIAVLGAAYDAAAVPKPWNYKNVRCYRTMKAEFPTVTVEPFKGVAHSAVDDAVNQALHLSRVWRHMRSAGVKNDV
jgi:hypothetical protein